MEIIDRIKEIINDKFGERGETSFANEIGIPQVTLNKYIRGRKPSIDTILAILAAYPDLSAEWLLRGKGKMYLNTTSTPDNQLIENLKEELLMLKGENRVLREQIGLGERKDKEVKSAS